VFYQAVVMAVKVVTRDASCQVMTVRMIISHYNIRRYDKTRKTEGSPESMAPTGKQLYPVYSTRARGSKRPGMGQTERIRAGRETGGRVRDT
jgi:hypothetical protein